MSRFVLAVLAVLLVASAAWAEPTEIVVHVRGQGSKFIGTSMAGARVILENADTGAILAQGVTKGSTGDTDRTMTDKRDASAVIVTPETARFAATLDLDEPTRIRVRTAGPLAQPQTGNEATATRWVVPGKHVRNGNAWLVELPGLTVDVLEPRAASRAPAGSVSISANVVMNCGCPITPGGLWNADVFEVVARIAKDGAYWKTVQLAYGGEPSLFTGEFRPGEPGVYGITVYAYDPRDGNTGIDRTAITVK